MNRNAASFRRPNAEPSVIAADGSTIKKVNDLGAAAYLLIHGYRPKGRDDRAIIFEVPLDDNEIDSLLYDYLSSDFARFDSALMQIKKLRDGNYFN